MITARHREKTVTRNSSFFKLVRQKDGPAEGSPTDEDYDDLEDADVNLKTPQSGGTTTRTVYANFL
jgi:hypothetical protein